MSKKPPDMSKIMKSNKIILNSTFCLTGNQWKHFNIGTLREFLSAATRLNQSAE